MEQTPDAFKNYISKLSPKFLSILPDFQDNLISKNILVDINTFVFGSDIIGQGGQASIYKATLNPDSSLRGFFSKKFPWKYYALKQFSGRGTTKRWLEERFGGACIPSDIRNWQKTQPSRSFCRSSRWSIRSVSISGGPLLRS